MDSFLGLAKAAQRQAAAAVSANSWCFRHFVGGRVIEDPHTLWTIVHGDHVAHGDSENGFAGLLFKSCLC